MTAAGRGGGLLLALLSVLLATVAQLALKYGMSALPTLDLAGNWPPWSDLAGWHWWWIAVGLGCYGLSMVVWIKVLTMLPLSVAYPVLSLSYVLVYLLATMVPAFGELASLQRSVGVLLVVLGVALVAWPARESPR